MCIKTISLRSIVLEQCQRPSMCVRPNPFATSAANVNTATRLINADYASDLSDQFKLFWRRNGRLALIRFNNACARKINYLLIGRAAVESTYHRPSPDRRRKRPIDIRRGVRSRGIESTRNTFILIIICKQETNRNRILFINVRRSTIWGRVASVVLSLRSGALFQSYPPRFYTAENKAMLLNWYLFLDALVINLNLYDLSKRRFNG